MVSLVCTAILRKSLLGDCQVPCRHMPDGLEAMPWLWRHKPSKVCSYACKQRSKQQRNVKATAAGKLGCGELSSSVLQVMLAFTSPMSQSATMDRFQQ